MKNVCDLYNRQILFRSFVDNIQRLGLLCFTENFIDKVQCGFVLLDLVLIFRSLVDDIAVVLNDRLCFSLLCKFLLCLHEVLRDLLGVKLICLREDVIASQLVLKSPAEHFV